MKERFTFIYRIRGLLMVPPVLAAVFISYGETEQRIMWPAGLLVFLAGLLIRIWAQMHLHYRLRVHKKLTMTGPYQYVRNPIYIANTLILLSLTMISELLWFLPVMLLWCIVVYSMVVRREEDHLTNKYGEPYVEFCNQTPRWFPRLPRTSAGKVNAMEFLWPGIVAELHCFLWLIPFVAKEFIPF